MALAIDLDDQAAREVARQIVHQVMLVAALNPGSRLAVLNAIDKIDGQFAKSYRRAINYLHDAYAVDHRCEPDEIEHGFAPFMRDAATGLIVERRD